MEQGTDEGCRTCPVCQSEFTPTQVNQRFCPPPKGKAKSRCARRWDNHMHRHGVPPDGPVIQPFDCAWCGKHCVPGENVVAHASRFCSKEHKTRWHHKHSEGRGWPQCRVSPPVVRRWTSGSCPECGEVVTRLKSIGHGYCSRVCQQRQKRRRRRARKAGVGSKALSFRTVALRDRWTCQLCGEEVDVLLRFPDPMCATLDHVVPLAMGGEHCESNAQLAHWRCNTLKGDGTSATPLGGQLALV